MLLTKFVEVKSNSANFDKYSALGYKPTGGIFTIPTKDILPSSVVLVTIKCDNCGRIQEVGWQGYTRNTKHPGLCRKCWPRPATKITISWLFKEFAKRGYVLCTPRFANARQPLHFYCTKHNDILQHINYTNFYTGKGCYYCYIETRSGANGSNWKGGVSGIKAYLRESITDWKNCSKRACNYKCVVTEGKFKHIHHLVSFDNMVSEVLTTTGIPIKLNVSEYAPEELKLLAAEILKLHFSHPLGVCLTKELHAEFHHAHGRGNNTLEQFQEFYYNKTGKIFVPKYKEVLE